MTTRGKVKCLCILGISRKRARKTIIVPITQCPVHGGLEVEEPPAER